VTGRRPRSPRLRGPGVGTRAVVAAAVALVLAAPSAARAEEGELSLAAAPLYSVVKWDQRHPSGGGLAVEGTWGLNDWLWLRGTVFYTAQAARGDEAAGLPSGAISVGGAFVGLRYAFDVLRVIPYVDGGVGALFSGGAGQARRVDLGVEVGIGFDYLYSRRLTFGLMVRYHAFTTNIEQIPVYLYAGPRVALVWD
jgi:hypothetical protein